MAPLPHCRELVDDQRIPELLTADAHMKTKEKLKQVHIPRQAGVLCYIEHVNKQQ